MQHPEIRIANRQVSVASQGRVKYKTVGRAVHGLDALHLAFALHKEHVVFIYDIMTAGFPQLVFKHSRGVHFREPSYAILLSHEVLQSVEYLCAVRQEKSAAGSQGRKEKQFLFSAHISVVEFF